MLYSIITINRNNAAKLEETIRSVVSQDRDLYEYIIIDGASTDGSLEVIKKYESEIDYYISEPDKGIYNAMNKGIARAQGQYAIFMNSGDSFSYPTALNDVSRNRSEADFIFCGWTRVKNGKPLASYLPLAQLTLYTLYYESTCICHQSTFTRVDVLKEMQGFDESLKISADIFLVIKAFALHRKTYQVLPYYIANLDIVGLSNSQEGLALLSKEKPAYFKTLCPHIYDDYVKMHSICRFSPMNILRVIKMRIWKDKSR